MVVPMSSPKMFTMETFSDLGNETGDFSLPGSHPAREPPSQPASHPASQPASQPGSHPAREP